MTERTAEKKLLQWHPAFFAGLQIEFAEEAEKLIFENEHQLSKKPMEIDVLIIKKKAEERLRKNIGRIFRRYNIVEYKSPEDYLSIDDFYKVYGYACFYKSDTEKVDLIKADEITISFVCENYPRKLMKHLEEIRKYEIVKIDKGIYYIMDVMFPMQLILTSELSKKSNFWLRNLTNRLTEHKEVNDLATEYEKHKNNDLYKALMNIIIRANETLFEEVKDEDMCEALRELFHDEIEEAERKASIEAKRNTLLDLLREGILSTADVASRLNITEAEVTAMLSN